jgi:hypothetical protein
MNASSVPSIDPGQWLPEVRLYTDAQRECWAVRRDKITWSDLEQARASHRVARARAHKRGWSRAYMQHSRWLGRLKTVLETFAPLMQDNANLTFTEACARMTRQSLKVVKEL